MTDVAMTMAQSEADWTRLMTKDLPDAVKALETTIGALRMRTSNRARRESLERARDFILYVSTQYRDAVAAKAAEDAGSADESAAVQS